MLSGTEIFNFFVSDHLKYCYKLRIRRQNGGDSYFLFYALLVLHVETIVECVSNDWIASYL